MTQKAGVIEKDHHIALWCPPSDVDQATHWPKVSAFYLRKGHDDLSANWLEYFSSDRARAIRDVVRTHPLQLRPRGRFAVLNVGEAVEAITAAGGESASITHTPNWYSNPSHASFQWDDMVANNQLMAAELHTLLLGSKDVLEAVLEE